MRRKELLSTVGRVLTIAVAFPLYGPVAPAATEKVLHTFVGVTQRGAYPQGSLVADAAGDLYGTTSQGGAYGYGTVFEVTPGSDGKRRESVLYSFQNGSDAASPSAGLVFDAAGNLYGCAGNVFELSPSSNGWTETTLYTFAGGDGGRAPNGSLAFDKAGNLYGTTAVGGAYDNCEGEGCGVVFELSPSSSGWKEAVIHNFGGGDDGAVPEGGVILDAAGNVYGTTSYGGYTNLCQVNGLSGCGTVFKLTRRRDGAWLKTTLYIFGSNYPYDGGRPTGSLTLDGSGNLYGAAGWVVFRLSHGSWKEEVLFDFNLSGGKDGFSPDGNLVFDSARNLYGTALYGGNSGCPNFYHNDNGCGTVFKLSLSKGSAWKERTLYRFTGKQDGGVPIGGVVLDSNGNLYGAASAAGIAGVGTVFKITSEPDKRWRESVFYGFTSNDGSETESSLISDNEGSFYGTTYAGGNGGNAAYCGGGCGTVFKLARDVQGHWTESLLYSFKGGNDGANATAGLIFDQAGNLYGTTETGGLHGMGTVYRVSPVSGGGWAESVLYSFQGGSDGYGPDRGVIFDAAGNLYGTTYYGGVYGRGRAWKIA